MKRILLVLIPMLVTALTSMPIFAETKSDARKSDKRSSQEKASGTQQKVPKVQDCEQVKSGSGGGVTESAAEKDCESSRHLGAGSGTSSGTGSGKMAPGQGPR